MLPESKQKIIKMANFFVNRLVILGAALCVVSVVLVVALFDLQIVRGFTHVPHVPSFERRFHTNAPRGEIFDAFGRPLAVNIPVFTVMLDPSVRQFDPNYSFQFFIDLMQRHGENIAVDSEFLITPSRPHAFTASATAQRRWMRDLGIDAEIIDAGLDAEGAYAILRELFEIPANLSPEDAHALLVMRTALHLQRLNLHQIPLASDVAYTTVAALEEHSRRIPGIYVAFDYLRYYPMGKYTTNIVGFINQISEADFAANRDLGLRPTDLFGAAGIERAFEDSLRGERGVTIIEVDGSFRRVNILEETLPVPGDNIHLTIDAVLQRNIYYILENYLSLILIRRLESQPTIFAREIVESMMNSGSISTLAIMTAGEDYPASLSIANFVRDNSDLADERPYRIQAINAFIGENLMRRRISMVTILEAMAEQGIITITDLQRAQLSSGQMTPAAFLTEKIETGQITPQMINIHPATGSVVVTCVRTGAILAAVNYPTFDANNFLAHTFDADYFRRVNADPTSPQFNRAFEAAFAPGSTFKMITALAALEEGIVTPTTRIFDHVAFRDAGVPYLHCMGSHGWINIVDAIAVSCNYFFARMAWNMGNHRDGRMIEGIETLNRYMLAVGLGSPTGAEIRERPAVTAVGGIPRIAGPSYKEALMQGAWIGGDTSNVSIGQGLVNHTAATMARYFAFLATGGIRYQMHLLGHIENAAGDITRFEPVIEHQMDINPTNMEAIHQGMYDVAFGARGTGRVIFAGFPMEVGLKSGTAETDIGISHSTYGGFAPFNDPQIAVYVVIPFGDNAYLRGSAGHVLRAVLEEYFALNPTGAGDGAANGLVR